MSDRQEVLSASLTLIRPGDDGPEVFWARRCADREFLGGFYAFFAGGVESDDDDLRSAALRECFEESGLLITDEGLRRFSPDERADAENPTIAAPHTLATSRLKCLGWWTTPRWLEPTFHTVFFGLKLSAEEGRLLDDLEMDLDRREFDEGRWITPENALRNWWRGHALSTRPIRAVLEAVRDRDHLDIAPALGDSRQNSETAESVEICGGVAVLPLKTPTLPPATHTNAFIIGDERFVIVDPGASGDKHLAPLIDYLKRRIDKGHRCSAVFVTHHHGDHIGGLKPLSRLVDAPILGHPETLRRLPELPLKTRQIEDGEVLEIDHPGPLQALYTPGHAPGHLALFQPDARLLFAGDVVASRGTIAINPPDGNMGQYLQSLRRLRDLDARALLPGHGPPETDPRKLLAHYLEHRQKREKMVLKALQDYGPATAQKLVPHVYADAPKAVWPLAARSLLAHLEHLVEQGQARHSEADDAFAVIDKSGK